MSDQLLELTYRIEDLEGDAGSGRSRLAVWSERLALWALRLLCLALLAWGAMLEARTSFVQSILFSRATDGMSFTLAVGPNTDIRFPKGGPYDERLGYVQLPSEIEALRARHFVVEQQAVPSPRLREFIDLGGYALYREKGHTGLRLLDRSGASIYATDYPERVYGEFTAVPPLAANTLLFVEDRHLLDADQAQHNPAVDWDRFGLAIVGQAAGWIDPRLKQGGASTLATQIEKFRHSPGGRTERMGEKLRQMLTASARAYADGPDTMAARRRILTTYLDATPLSSRPGFGEVIGVGEGLKAWYGTDFADANHVLTAPARTPVELARKAEVYKQVLSLLLAERRPSYYLATDRHALEALANQYLGLLSGAGVIDAALRDAALDTQLRFSAEPPAPPPVSFVGRKATGTIRARLLSALAAPSLYSLDRLDLTAQTTFDTPTQERITDVLADISDMSRAKALGLVGEKLLGAAEDPGKVTYSVVLYERGADRNYLRVHADSLDQPFDINSGAKLILGSTAKLRTLTTYLDIMTELHARYGHASASELSAAYAKAQDPLSRWAIGFIAGTADRSLQTLLDAAMQRRYSGDPSEVFFTGGGQQVFHNFEKSEDHEVPTVFEAFEHSVNLAFVRIMRDIAHYYTTVHSGGSAEPQWGNNQEAARESYLRRFADQEGRVYLNRFYDDYQERTPEEALSTLAGRASPTPRRLAMIFRSARPEASAAELQEFLARHLPKLSLDAAAVESFYAGAAVERYSLADRGYLAGVHPLELWLVAYLQTHPKAPRAEVISASASERQDVYTWLFKTHNEHAQDVRIRVLQEEDAFNGILEDWRRQGYPFGHLVPSYASAIGSSGDRPDALAHLMGIILNDGVKLPTSDIERVSFAADTPFETDMALQPEAPKRVLAPEVAATLRRALMGVVREGTGTRAKGAFHGADGSALAIGGKTGTGDNRFETFAAAGKLIESRVVDRTATFVFFIGDRFFGTITAYVPGADAANYHFTSALAAQLLKSLAPQIQPLIDGTTTTVQRIDGSISMISARGDAAAIGNPQPIPPAIPLRSPQPTLRAR
ncbi:MAG TPA: transglycosylase domain-containing protein [Stellaceae bacterium]|nr:transglycosylase domain-containing protein [Stellaceae bacterium]